MARVLCILADNDPPTARHAVNGEHVRAFASQQRQSATHRIARAAGCVCGFGGFGPPGIAYIIKYMRDDHILNFSIYIILYYYYENMILKICLAAEYAFAGRCEGANHRPTDRTTKQPVVYQVFFSLDVYARVVCSAVWFVCV